MKNTILAKAQNDPAYSQIVQLYSSLFDTQEERESFILDVANEDILLAAECKTSSVAAEDNLMGKILEKSFYEYKQIKSEYTISNYCLILIKFDHYNELIEVITKLNNLQGISKNVVNKVVKNISQNYQKSLLGLLNREFSSVKNIIDCFLISLNYDTINFKKEKQNILALSNKLVFTNFNLSFFYLMEKNTDYLLFEKKFIIAKVSNHFENNKIFEITILWINKYAIKHLFPDEYVLTKIIETCSWPRAFDFIENCSSIDIKKAVLRIIDSAMNKDAKIDFIINIAVQYDVIHQFSSLKLIEYSLKQKNHIGFEKIIEIYDIKNLEIKKKGVQHFINSNKPKSYLFLIKKYSLQSFFTLEYLLRNNHQIFFSEIIESFIEIYTIYDAKSIAISLANKYYNENKLGLAVSIIDKFNLWLEFSLNDLIYQAFNLKKWGLLTQWHSKYNLEEKYTIQSIIILAIENGDFQNARQIAKTFHLNFQDFYEISLGSIIKCLVRKIIPNRVFVKIENETRPASIHIGELTDEHMDNIFSFEYKGEKLHIGQKLVAKVISIDEQGRINLSLKY